MIFLSYLQLLILRNTEFGFEEEIKRISLNLSEANSMKNISALLGFYIILNQRDHSKPFKELFVRENYTKDEVKWVDKNIRKFSYLIITRLLFVSGLLPPHVNYTHGLFVVDIVRFLCRRIKFGNIKNSHRVKYLNAITNDFLKYIEFQQEENDNFLKLFYEFFTTKTVPNKRKHAALFLNLILIGKSCVINHLDNLIHVIRSLKVCYQRQIRHPDSEVKEFIENLHIYLNQNTIGIDDIKAVYEKVNNPQQAST